MSAIKRFYEERARELGLDEELTEETIEKIAAAEQGRFDRLFDQLTGGDEWKRPQSTR